MSQQPALFVESLADAVREVARAAGGMKALSSRVYPEKTDLAAAARLLNDCLNDGRAERLDPEKLLLIARIGRECGCHAVMHDIAADAGY